MDRRVANRMRLLLTYFDNPSKVEELRKDAQLPFRALDFATKEGRREVWVLGHDKDGLKLKTCNYGKGHFENSYEDFDDYSGGNDGIPF